MFMSLLHLLNAGFAGFTLLLLLAPIGFAGFVLLRIVRRRAKPFAAMAMALLLVPPIPAQAAIDNSQKANSCIRVTQESQGINYENICGRNINVTHCWDTRSVQGGGQCVFERSSAGVVGGSNFFIGANFVVVAACRPPFWAVNIRVVNYESRQVSYNCSDTPETSGQGGGGGGGGGSNLGLVLGAAALLGIGVYVLNSDGEWGSSFSINPLAAYEFQGGEESLRHGMRLSYGKAPWRLWWLADNSRPGWGGEWRGNRLRAYAEISEDKADFAAEWARAGWTIRPSVGAEKLWRPESANFLLQIGQEF